MVVYLSDSAEDEFDVAILGPDSSRQLEETRFACSARYASVPHLLFTPALLTLT
ncbi:hypothetical protein EXIGLDRAFT_717702 [Exidia glandulosa HHB12029]|uniref:Uncharacterized protein n=1 Tax=Exidia glandulosa HHB12029 TaxID=1314781 RepID=A0A166MMQ6_EXIGL|nr:hypothetical protein EXIGLDRAFT_717702 [Exidia glandulosa HHB12029]